MILLYFDMGLSFAEQRRTITILGWPTDEYSGSYSSPAHTVIFFVPENPGQHDWYRSDLRDILKRAKLILYGDFSVVKKNVIH